MIRYIKYFLGFSLSGKIRLWRNDFKKDKYYKADTRNIYSYITHFSFGDEYSVSFQLFCDHPIKSSKLDNYRVTIHSRTFLTRQDAENYQVKEIKKAAYFFPDSKFYRKSNNSWLYFYRNQWFQDEQDIDGSICSKCGQMANVVSSICPNCGDFMI
jgi:hypothetical protein